MQTYPEGVVLEDRPCPNGCPPEDRLVLEGKDRIHGIEGIFTVIQCVHCHLMRTNPRPTPATIGAYYPEDYGPYQTPVVAAVVPTRFKLFLRRLLGLDSRLTPPIPPGHLLEIGCANGAYMEQMRQNGWSAEGIEFSEAAAEAARARHFDVQTASVETAQQPNAQADIVAAWMVLEHLHEPVSALRKIRRWVKPNGYLIASVPDNDSKVGGLFGAYRYDLHLPNHLYHYSPETMKKVLNTAGWRVERILWQRNSNNLLWSIEYWAADNLNIRWLPVIRWLRSAQAASKIRVALGWLLGVTRQSGRMEVWARPADESTAIS